MNLLDKDGFTEADINAIISNQVEESVHIEFKSAAALLKQDKPKAEISKDVSAFANSDGGLIFYGIIEENHVASAVDYVDGDIYNKEWLENVITSNIQQTIQGLKIFPVRFNNEISKTVYVVKIPSSERAPHMCNDKKYYRRYNFKSVTMEEYEIRNLYLRATEGKVIYESISLGYNTQEDDKFDPDELYSFGVEIHFTNESNFIAKNYKLSCRITSVEGIDFNYRNDARYQLTKKPKCGVLLSTMESIPIFPEEILSGLVFNVHVDKLNFLKSLNTINLTLSVYNQNEMSEHDLTKNFIDLAQQVK